MSEGTRGIGPLASGGELEAMFREDIDDILSQWDYDDEQVVARIIRAEDGREVVQMRLDLGLLQMESDDRPDGRRPEGFVTYLDYLRDRYEVLDHEGKLTGNECSELDRELLQFYHRRVCWLALREFGRAVRDAKHTLALMDFARVVSPSEEWDQSHERHRPLVLFHLAQAAALKYLASSGPEAAIARLDRGVEHIEKLAAIDRDAYDSDESRGCQDLVDRLEELRDAVREQYSVDRTLEEKLDDAVATEDYEMAARLRDELDRRRAN